MTESNSQQEPPTPPPYVVEPRQAPALQSFILLHGAGDSAPNFGAFLLATRVRGADTLAELFPRARFVFPHARRRVVARHGSATSTRWFDWWSLDAPEQREDVQVEGLRENVALVHGLLRAEAARVGAANVVLGGLSNGAAQAMVAMLLYEGEPLAGLVGMCGWLPYARKLEARAEGIPGGGGGSSAGNPEVSKETSGPVSWLAREIGWTWAGELGSTPASLKKPSTPVFLGHGDADQTVPWQRMPDAKASLEALGFEVRSETYTGLGHWYSRDMLSDIVDWLEPRVEFTKPSE